MKNYVKLLLLVFAIPMVISSCKDDDESPGAVLIGTWEEVSYATSGCTDSDDNDSFTCSSSCERVVITENTITFEGDPAEPYTVTGSTISFTTTIGSTTITETVNYAISGTTLTITFKDDASDGGCLNTLTYRKV
ncbi:MAG: hypothetical protein WAU36_16910 [Cyclobacteriaceae bacterium]